MDSLSFDTSSKKSKILYTSLALVGIICVVGTIALTSSNSSSPGLQQFQLEVEEFNHFLARHNKLYSTAEEYARRFKVFRDNSAFIRIHNSQAGSWVLKANQFADVSFAEFKSLYLGTKAQAHYTKRVAEENNVVIPDAIDWREAGAVTKVKNQGICGGCWAFSTTGAVEGAWFLANHTLVSLSEQELIDCSRSYGNEGCNGGLMDYGFEFVIQNGLTTEKHYKYTGRDGICNQTKVANVSATISGYVDVTPNNSTALLAALTHGPVSVGVQADQAAWQFYGGGVIDKSCGTNLDHGVLVVGFNRTTVPAYYIVKNSWGPSWGEDGYIRIAIKEGKGLCGIQMMPSYPIVNK
ncbi:unnamed protein product [Blepharisma stoltei]|uniref:Cysteine protease n=1 Tax=Blepharisma stoltei TaxID=1481888 RepID=A0AAU9J2D1_9CILI|nr:unnamed protein product [Blepharisma stoltei]